MGAKRGPGKGGFILPDLPEHKVGSAAAKQAGGFCFDLHTAAEATAKYRQALEAALALFEGAIKLCVLAQDSVALNSLQGEVTKMIEKAKKTLRHGPAEV